MLSLTALAGGGLQSFVRCSGTWRGPARTADFRPPPSDGNAGRRDIRPARLGEHDRRSLRSRAAGALRDMMDGRRFPYSTRRRRTCRRERRRDRGRLATGGMGGGAWIIFVLSALRVVRRGRLWWLSRVE